MGNPAVKNLLSFRNTRIEYPGSPRPVLQNFSMELKQGELLCVLGPSGCGKSTLLKAAAGLISPAKGSITLSPSSPERLYPRVLVLQQEDQLFPWMTVEDNAGIPLKRGGNKNWRQKTREILASLSMGDAAGLYPHQLSGGMRQRAVLARALAAEPELLMLDEPFAHLDASVRSSLQHLVTDIWQQKESMPSTILFVTHDIQEALVLASRILLFDSKGNIREDRIIELPRPRDPFDEELVAMVREIRNLLD